MKKAVSVTMLLLIVLSVLFVPSFAAEQAEVIAEPADTGDMFSIVIAMLLTSAMGVAALIAHKTRFVHEDTKKAGG